MTVYSKDKAKTSRTQYCTPGSRCFPQGCRSPSLKLFLVCSRTKQMTGVYCDKSQDARWQKGRWGREQAQQTTPAKRQRANNEHLGSGSRTVSPVLRTASDRTQREARSCSNKTLSTKIGGGQNGLLGWNKTSDVTLELAVLV